MTFLTWQRLTSIESEELGRAGENGIAYSFCDAEEKDYLLDIQKLIKKQIPVGEHPFAMDSSVQFSKPAPPQKQNGQQRTGQNRKRFFDRNRMGAKR